MKILLVSNLYPPTANGGAERSTALLGQALADQGLEIVVATLAPGGGPRTASTNGTRLHLLPLRNVYWPFDTPHSGPLRAVWHAVDTCNPFVLHDLVGILRSEKPDLMQTSNLAGFSTSAWLAARRCNVPVVHTLRDYYLLCPRSTMFREGRDCRSICPTCRLYAEPRRWLSEIPSAVVGISRFILDRHIGLGWFRNVPITATIHNAHGIATTCDAKRPGKAKPLRFGYLGRLHPSKGVGLLLDAASRLPPRSWSATIAGRGPAEYERQLKATYAHRSIAFVGWADASAFFSAIDVLVVPSLWHEPLGRVVIEAYAHGVPVIGSTRGGIPELVEPEATGLLFDPARPDTLTAAMQRLVANPDLIPMMSRRCIEKARSFDSGAIAKQYIGVYDETLARARQGAPGGVPYAAH